MTLSLPVADVVAIQQLCSLYGHIIDAKKWDEMDRLFVADAVFDATEFGEPITHTLADLRAVWALDSTPHPFAHHITNVVVYEEGGEVRIDAKGLAALPGGKVSSMLYHDVVRKTPDGWRFSERRAVKLRP